MKIRSIEERVVSIASEIKNAYIDFSRMTVSVVKIETDVMRKGKPICGYGFNSNGRYAQRGLLRERFIPRLLDADPRALLDDSGVNIDPFKCWALLMSNEKPGGHGERSVAVGVLDMALWDIVAKIEEKPLCRLLAERYRGSDPDEKVFVYAAGGYYYPGKDNSMLQQEMSSYLELGYNVVKIKIGGSSLADDISRIEALCALFENKAGQKKPGSNLMVDANGRFDMQLGLDYAQALQDYGLFWFEEPGDPLDYRLQAVLSERYEGSMATGENLFSHQDVRNLLRHGGMRTDRDYLQMDPVLSYGLVEYMRMLQQLDIHGWSWRRCVPHGGHQFALHIAAGLGLGGNESYPLVFAPFGGFADNTPIIDGYIRLNDTPGIGFEDKEELYTLFCREFSR